MRPWIIVLRTPFALVALPFIILIAAIRLMFATCFLLLLPVAYLVIGLIWILGSTVDNDEFPDIWGAWTRFAFTDPMMDELTEWWFDTAKWNREHSDK